MEEAYNELYQQFLHLRSLCLKQAALLHQLTAALQKQPGASALNGEVSDLISVPAGIPSSLYEKPQSLRAGLLVPAETCMVEESSCKAGTLSLLAEDVLKLSVDVPRCRKQDDKTEKMGSFMQTSDSSGYLGASYGKFRFEQNGPAEDRAQYTSRTPVSDCASQVGDLLHQAGGALMSDVALHSHICEFCQAVFPGDSTTRGEFLRHLCTHVT